MAATKRPVIEVEGGPQLRKAFKRLDDRLGDLKDAHHDVGQMVADRAEELVPRETGELAASIRADRRSSGASVLAGKSRLPYAGPIHFGWRARNIEPQPFLYDALDDRRDEVLRTYTGAVDGLIRRWDSEAP